MQRYIVTRPLACLISFVILTATTVPLTAQETPERSDWMDRQMQGLERTLHPPEQDVDANQAGRDALENSEADDRIAQSATDSAISGLHLDIGPIGPPRSDQADLLRRRIDLKQQELAEEYRNYRVADRQIHNMTDRWIPLFEALVARGEMYQPSVIAPPQDPADRLAQARQSAQESRAEKDRAAARIWELRRHIATLRRRLWSRPDQTPFNAIETDLIDDEKLNLYLTLTAHGLDLPTETVLPSARQRATEQALAEATREKQDAQIQLAREVAEHMEAYLHDEQTPPAQAQDGDHAVPEDEPLVAEEQLTEDVNDILSGDEAAPESPEVRQLCDNILQGLKESRQSAQDVIKYLDESARITAVIDGAETVFEIRDIVQTTRQLNETAGEDAAMAYLSARVAALVAKSVGGMYEAAGVYLQIGAKTLHVGSNVTSKAVLGPNEEVSVHHLNFGPNKAIRHHSAETDQGLRALNVAVQGQAERIDIYFWKQIYIEGPDGHQTEAWVPYDDLGNPYDYVFLVTSRPYALGLLGKYDMEVYQADTQQLDATQTIAVKAKGSYKN